MIQTKCDDDDEDNAYGTENIDPRKKVFKLYIQTITLISFSIVYKKKPLSPIKEGVSGEETMISEYSRIDSARILVPSIIYY